MGYNSRQVYGSTRLKADDLEGKQPAVLTIVGVELAEFTDRETHQKKRMLELAFGGTEKTLLLNFSNANLVTEWFGEDTDGWINRKIVLYFERVLFGVKMVGAIRIRSVEQELLRRELAKRQTQPAMTPSRQAEAIADTHSFGSSDPNFIATGSAIPRPRDQMEVPRREPASEYPDADGFPIDPDLEDSDIPF